MDASRIRKIREEMDRAEARRLQPHFIAAFFLEAFKLLGGTVREREPKRYEIKHVPAIIRNRDRLIGMGEVVLTRYERICFEKDLISVPQKPLAAFIAPGHPLLDATTDIILERHRNLLRQGAVFVNESDPAEAIRALFYIDHSVADARADSRGNRRVVSRQVRFVEIDEQESARNAGYAPYLDYRPLKDEERDLIAPSLTQPWLRTDLESRAVSYAITRLVPEHFQFLKERKEEQVSKTIQAVKDRLTKEIAYLDHRAAELKAQEQAGKVNARINSDKARSRADELHGRLQKRLQELEKERQISPLPPVVMGGALVIPAGLLARLKGKREQVPGTFARETRRVELLAMQAVTDMETSLGFQPRDVSQDNCGYDVESVIPETGKLRFIEVKGRVEGAETVTVTKNEILTALNKPDDFILAIVVVPPSKDGETIDPWQAHDPDGSYSLAQNGCRIYYIRRPFFREPDFNVTSVNYNLAELLANAEVPS